MIVNYTGAELKGGDGWGARSSGWAAGLYPETRDGPARAIGDVESPVGDRQSTRPFVWIWWG